MHLVCVPSTLNNPVCSPMDSFLCSPSVTSGFPMHIVSRVLHAFSEISLAFPLGLVLKYARRFSASFSEHAVRWNGLANAWGNPQVMLFLFSVLCAFRCLPFVLHRLSPWSMYKQPCFSSGLTPLPRLSPLCYFCQFSLAHFLVRFLCIRRVTLRFPCVLLRLTPVRSWWGLPTYPFPSSFAFVFLLPFKPRVSPCVPLDAKNFWIISEGGQNCWRNRFCRQLRLEGLSK